MKPLLVAVVLLCLLSCSSNQTSERSQSVRNLHALSKLYGVVRWFHPSDEAAEIDWNNYAVSGVQSVMEAQDSGSLQQALTQWVAPIGPTVQILASGEQSAANAIDAAATQVAWQYHGPGFGNISTRPYKSKRTERLGYVERGRGWGAVAQKVDAVSLRGKLVRLRAQVKAGEKSKVGAWLRVDLANGNVGFFDNMDNRPVTVDQWTPVEILGKVALDAEALAFGGLAWGQQGWFDAFSLEVGNGQGAWQPVTIENPNMDRGTSPWGSDDDATIEPEGRDGGPALHYTGSSDIEEITEDLFEARPEAAEAVVVELGSGLRAVVPISLPSVDARTTPVGDLDQAQRNVASAQLQPGSERANQRARQLADIIVAWNVIAHFYPYHDVLTAPWSARLDELLGLALASSGTNEHEVTLKRLIAAFEDGHGSLGRRDRQHTFPVRFVQAENQLVVAVSELAEVQLGDLLVSIDGVAAADALEQRRQLVSGSKQWTTERALRRLGAGLMGSKAQVVLERDGVKFNLQAVREVKDAPDLYTYPPIEEVEPSVWLVDLSRAEMDNIAAQMETIAAASGVVFDLRGYPNQTHDVLRHLVAEPEQDRWMHVANVVRPRLPTLELPEWESFGWNLEPVEPKIAGKVVFLTGPGAISYAESVMGYVEAFALPIVGSGPTAGANGNVRKVALPSGAQFWFTGMKVTRHDGTPSHNQGIRPTVLVEPTIAGIRAGHDEVLQRALAMIRSNQ